MRRSLSLFRTKAELVCRLYSLRSSSTGATPAQLACWHGKMQLSLRMSFATTIDSRLKANSSGPSSGCLMAFHHLTLPAQSYSFPGVWLEVAEISSMRNGEFFEVSLSPRLICFRRQGLEKLNLTGISPFCRRYYSPYSRSSSAISSHADMSLAERASSGSLPIL